MDQTTDTKVMSDKRIMIVRVFVIMFIIGSAAVVFFAPLLATVIYLVLCVVILIVKWKQGMRWAAIKDFLRSLIFEW